MTTRTIDLRSDTVTQPTPAMRDAMFRATVGDDGSGEDPTVNELESRFAQLLGKESSIFVPSGVMANQIAVRILTQPGDVIVAGRQQHVVSFEMGAAARNSGVQFATVDDHRGILSTDEVCEFIDAERDHQPHIGLVAIENTHMPSGGTPWSADEVRELASKIGSVRLHMDGARLFNAVVATGTSALQYAEPVDTVMCCLSKGLCAPVGSLLAGSNELMQRARVERKRLGGAMRQAGFLAAAGLVALETMIDRLAVDHANARLIADAVAAAFPSSVYDPSTCHTNIVAFTHPRAREIVAWLAENSILAGTVAPQRARLVTHADLGESDIARACEVISTWPSN
jgi:threonine aldolase